MVEPIIISGPTKIHVDGNELEKLFGKYPAFKKKLRMMVDRYLDKYLITPFHSESKTIMIQEIKENITFFNPNFKKGTSPTKEKIKEDKEKNAYDIYTIEGQTKNFYENQPFFFDKNKMFHLWDKELGKWEICDDVDMLNKLKEFIPNANTITSKTKAEIMNALMQIGRNKKPLDMPKTWIQFKDKIVDVLSGEEFEASPKYYTTNPLPWKLGDSSETPTIDKLIKEWVVDDKNQDETYIKTTKQIIAYIVSSDQFLQRLIALCGAGMNGKGTYVKLITKFIGMDNVCTSDLKILVTNNFEASSLYKKLLCVMGEVDVGDLKSTNTIKKISGEDDMRYEFKGKGSFSEPSPTTALIQTNSLPITPDKAIGFYRKWLIIDFPNQFKVKRDLIGNIPDEEFENLGRCVLELLKEMYKTNEFTNEGTLDERINRYEERSNPIIRFVENECVEEFALKIEFREFCRLVNIYLKSKHLRAISPIQIGKILRNEGYEISPRKIKIENQEVSAKFIIGVGIKTTRTTQTTQISSQSIRSKSSENLGSYGSSGSFIKKDKFEPENPEIIKIGDSEDD